MPFFNKIYTGSLCLLLCSLAARGQNIPNLSQTAPSGATTVQSPPAAITAPSSKYNYVRTLVPKIHQDDTALVAANNTANITAISTAYKDGFNRTIQSVVHGYSRDGSGDMVHLVQPYDTRYQKDDYSYLPYTEGGNAGFRSNAFQEQQEYYQALYPGDSGTSYTRTVNGTTSSARLITSYLPGKSQVGQSKGVKKTLVANDAYVSSETPLNVRLITVGGADTIRPAGWYPANSLYGTEYDQDGGGKYWTFENKDKRLICKKEIVKDTMVSGVTQYIYGSTYYVYDESGRLRCIVPPAAVSSLSTGSAVSATVLNNLCFQYFYDSKGRLSSQRDPGKGAATELVYDRKERLVMRRTALEASKNIWEVLFYDGQDRPVATSYYSDNHSRTWWQDSLDTGTPGTLSSQITYYLMNDAGEGLRPAENAISGNRMMSYTWYDNYSEADPTGSVFTDLASNLNFTETVSSTGYEMPERSERTQQLGTKSRTRILPSPTADTATTGDWSEVISYYDDKGRVSFSLSRDYYHDSLIRYHANAFQYNFSNQVLVNKHVAWNGLSSDIGPRTEIIRNEYEWGTGRLYKSYHKVDTGGYNLIATYSYDALGRVSRKTLGDNGEVQDMSYNIRGQLNGINADYAETGSLGGQPNRSFGESLKYDFGFSNPRIDGKIAGMVWRSKGQTKPMAYGYSYDRGGRLTGAEFRRYEPGGSCSSFTASWCKQLADYSVSNLSYDLNGNILSMDQRAVSEGGVLVDMDQLTYTYAASSNQLVRVVDNATTNYALGDFYNTNGNQIDYAYDADGNLRRDANKTIDSITYTFFGKPNRIRYHDGRYVEYSYNAAGEKIQELLSDSIGTPVRTDYNGNFVYGRDTLMYSLTPEGRAVYVNGTYDNREEFFVKDHLGSVRSVIDVKQYPIREYLATYEVASAYLEGLFFDHMNEIRSDKPGSFDTADVKAGNLNGGDSLRRIGTSILLKVMAGDAVSMNVNSYYEDYDAEQDSPAPAEDMLRSLLGTLNGGAGGFSGSESYHEVMPVDLFTSVNYGGFNELLDGLTDPSRPKAYLNYVLFDETMTMVQEMSGAFQAQGDGTWAEIGTAAPLTVPANGYLAVYLSNSTQIPLCGNCGNVYFDQLVLKLSHGTLKEEAHYYPHGLPIHRMGSTAGSYLPNRHKYQGNELTQQLGLNLMDFNARQYDPQLGRFLSLDPKAAQGGQEKFSPYAAMGNAPESTIDPNGDIFAPFNQSNIAMASSMSFSNYETGSGDPMGSTWAQNLGALRDGSGKLEIEWNLGPAAVNPVMQKILSDMWGSLGMEVNFNVGIGSLMCNFADAPVVASSDGGGDEKTRHAKFSEEEVAEFQNATPPVPEHAKIVAGAYALEGSTKYDVKDLWGESWKCNLFVYDVLSKAGASPGLPNGNSVKKFFGMGSPPLAFQWADPSYKIPGWVVVKTPQAGDVVATGTKSGGAHVAIMITPTTSMGANKTVVHITTFGSSQGMLQHSWPGNNGYVFRRYVGQTN